MRPFMLTSHCVLSLEGGRGVVTGMYLGELSIRLAGPKGSLCLVLLLRAYEPYVIVEGPKKIASILS